MPVMYSVIYLILEAYLWQNMYKHRNVLNADNLAVNLSHCLPLFCFQMQKHKKLCFAASYCTCAAQTQLADTVNSSQ